MLSSPCDKTSEEEHCLWTPFWKLLLFLLSSSRHLLIIDLHLSPVRLAICFLRSCKKMIACVNEDLNPDHSQHQNEAAQQPWTRCGFAAARLGLILRRWVYFPSMRSNMHVSIWSQHAKSNAPAGSKRQILQLLPSDGSATTLANSAGGDLSSATVQVKNPCPAKEHNSFSSLTKRSWLKPINRHRPMLKALPR